ncbi:MAG: TonB-dependent receptor [Ignavibacteria bacterium]|nr:MAG: TonB-dependent receptor [Ignavibacteria bacterium]KAF0159944.1 MAG: TonB-dependent receptor [Ignavibacteria bacterium]
MNIFLKLYFMILFSGFLIAQEKVNILIEHGSANYISQSLDDENQSNLETAGKNQSDLYKNTNAGNLKGIVISKEDNRPLIGANVLVLGTGLGASTNENGEFSISNLPVKQYSVQISMLGYEDASYNLTITNGESISLNIELEPKPVDLPVVEITGSSRSVFMKIPGSAEVISSKAIMSANPVGFNEVLRKVGIYVREEEGFGMRPNIGIRGLFPTRSSKVLLLEDGVPFTQAPYGDPAAYYHPPVTRFDRIEVLRGSGQILFGPQTIGGVINYLTPPTPEKTTGFAKVMSGNRNYLYGQFDFGSSIGPVGFKLDYTHKKGQLARENSSTNLNDITGKFVFKLDEQSKVSLKASYYKETSNVTYAGLTKVEFDENPFQNKFKDDWFYVDRYGAHAIYDRYLGTKGAALAVNVYGYQYKRDWWRQGNNGGTNSTNPGNTPGVRTVLNPTRNDGRNRLYKVWGIEPKFRANHTLFGVLHELDFGLRAHFEIQDRKQIEGNSSTARTGTLREDNLRNADAYSLFLQDRVFLSNQLVLSGGVRVENVHYSRTNNLNKATGKTSLTEVIPGIGITYNPLSNITLYSGVHRGFAPPRVEDAISNVDGSSVELDPEKSWNLELGIRTKLFDNLNINATIFQMNFENQIVPASIAGGLNTALTNAGKTIHQGVEFRSETFLPLDTEAQQQIIFDLAYTYLPTAKFSGERFSAIDRKIKVSGNRLMYAPEHILTTSAAFELSTVLLVRLEAVYVSEQFSDDLNTITITPNGRQGKIPSHTIWNFSGNYTIKPLNLTMVLTVKNIFDKVYLVDLSRGMLPGNPQLIHYGLEWNF